MFIPDSGGEFIPIFYCYENGKEVVNDLLKNKTVEYVGSEETEHETYIGKYILHVSFLNVKVKILLRNERYQTKRSV